MSGHHGYSPSVGVTRHVVVTGGSSGLGRSIAAIFASRGDRVSLIARDATRLRAAAERMDGEVQWAVADVTDRAELSRAIGALVDASGSCDVLVAAAGAARPGHFNDLDDRVFRDQLELNYFGTLNAIRLVAPSMIERRGGSLIAVASTATLLGVYGLSAYAPSKSAVCSLMEVLRVELKPHGIYVGCVLPPDMDTPGLVAENRTKPAECARISAGITPRSPDDVARRVVRGIDRSKFLITADMTTRALTLARGLLSPAVHHFVDRAVRQVQIDQSKGTNPGPDGS